jgi:hypothetical protein
MTSLLAVPLLVPCLDFRELSDISWWFVQIPFRTLVFFPYQYHLLKPVLIRMMATIQQRKSYLFLCKIYVLSRGFEDC